MGDDHPLSGDPRRVQWAVIDRPDDDAVRFRFVARSGDGSDDLFLGQSIGDGLYLVDASLPVREARALRDALTDLLAKGE